MSRQSARTISKLELPPRTRFILSRAHAARRKESAARKAYGMTDIRTTCENYRALISRWNPRRIEQKGGNEEQEIARGETI